MARHEDDHVRIRPIEDFLEIFCERCKAAEKVSLPVLMLEMSQKSSDFIKAHRDCDSQDSSK